MNLYVASLKYYPIMGGPAKDDTIHVIAANRTDAVEEAMRHAIQRPLYGLACWTPAVYDCVCKGPVDDVE